MLPNSLNLLSKLRSLILFKNPLNSLPDSLLELKNLEIRIDHTQFNNLTPELRKKFRNYIYIIGI